MGKKENTQKWINVNEKLPHSYQPVLAYDTQIGQTVALYKDGFYGMDNKKWLEFVTHWMPLPDKPKEG